MALISAVYLQRYSSFWGTPSPDPLPRLCPWTPLGDFHPPDLLLVLPQFNLLNPPLAEYCSTDRLFPALISDLDTMKSNNIKYTKQTKN